ncbi:hypothetical protein T459_17396 [Capsicum annuum]|uniref:Uncharacterized protein n=1 Tax=Capsicum annuum TaxID=4072 RepID=A0A2G2ZBL7_CAPAN|nr:hypothetical protein T459_17396 [Capsicum annuum]
MNLMDSKVGLPYFVDLGVNLTYLGMHFVDLRMCFEDLGMDSKTGSVGLRMDFVDACEVEFDARILHPQPEWAYLVPDSMLRRGSFSTTPFFERGLTFIVFGEESEHRIDLRRLLLDLELPKNCQDCAIAAQGLLKRTYSVLNNPKHMVATQGDLVFADAFIRGDFSFVDKNSGLLNLFMSEEEDLKVAQERKISLIIEKPSDEASRPISPMDVRRSRDDNDLNDIL